MTRRHNIPASPEVLRHQGRELFDHAITAGTRAGRYTVSDERIRKGPRWTPDPGDVPELLAWIWARIDETAGWRPA